MQVVETKVYTFDELNDDAKERAREWYRGADDFSFYAESVMDDAKAVAALMGIDIKRIYYSGFYSQGDGACFEGIYAYKKGGAKAVIEYAPQDTELHRIARALTKLQKQHFYRLYATVKHSGHYYHSGCTNIDVIDENQSGGYPSSAAGTEDALEELLRDYMNWIYSQLEKEYDWLNADPQIDESILAHEYTFTENGERF